MNKFHTQKGSVIVFFILTFIISWGAILLIFGSKGIPATRELQEQIGMVILFGPFTASILLIFLNNGMKGLRNLGSALIKWRTNIKWYMIALFTAPVSTLTGLAIFSLFTNEFRPAILNTNEPTELVLLGIIGGLTIGLFEEIGWTGFATPRLLKKTTIYKTGIIIGLLWGAWHFILFWENDSFQKTIPFLLLLARLFAWLPAYRIIMVWVYKSTHSLLILIIMHACLVLSLVALDPVIYGIDLLIYILIRASILWLIVGIITALNRQTAR